MATKYSCIISHLLYGVLINTLFTNTDSEVLSATKGKLNL